MVSALLAGGENRRFPALKGFIEVGGRRLVELNAEKLRSVSEKVVISTNEPGHYFYLGLPMVGDAVPSRGPASGVVSVLLATRAHAVFAVACDMPFVNVELARYIASRAAGDATVPVYRGRPEPLFAVYSRGVLGAFEEGIRAGRSSITEMLGPLDVCYIEEEDVRRIDPEGRSFININTPEDYEAAFKGALRAA
jgi:molybdopterin-guanine dinucleotide biosynthesis protein A